MGIKNILSFDSVKYVVVRPHRGMKDGYEVINDFNENRMDEFGPDEKDEAIAYARDRAATSSSFDQVLVTYEPERKESQSQSDK